MRTALLTGASGFLGNFILKGLSESNLRFKTLGRSQSDYEYDIAKKIKGFNEEFENIIHTAGKAHVMSSTTADREAFWKVNYEGTKNLCEALQNAGNLPSNFVFISTVSVYGLDEGQGITENAPLAGTSPYAKSKIEAEKWLTEWADRNRVNLLIFRLPLIAGPNPPGNLGAMINGIKTGRYFRIGKGNAKKSVVLASDIADIIAKSIGKSGIYNLTDGYHPSFSELEKTIAEQLNKKLPPSIPLPLAKLVGRVGDLIGEKFPLNSIRLSKITNTLTFNDDKARQELGWNPQRVLDGFKIDGE